MLHVRKTDPEMPEYRAKVMVKLRLEFIFGSHSVILSLSTAYTLPPLSVTELVIARDMIFQLSLYRMLAVVVTNRGIGVYIELCNISSCQVLQLLFP